MGFTVCERLAKNSEDMKEIEKVIVAQLGGENHRCSFFRSVPFIRLRIAALYLKPCTPHVAHCGDLSVILAPTDDGPLVSVYCKNHPVDLDAFEEDGSVEPHSPSCQKKPRLER